MVREGRKTILLVEDEAIIALAERQTLEKSGYDVITAASGEKAVEKVDSEAGIDLVLMDVNLGRGIDGAEAAKRILEKRDIPVVFLSSHTEPDVVEKTEAISSYGYIVKNSGDTVLLASIRMAFRLSDAKMREKREHRALVHSYDLMRYIIEHNRTAIAVFDRSMNYLYVSRRFLEEYNLAEKDVIGKNHYEMNPHIPEKWRAVHRKALAGEAMSVEDDPLVLEDGCTEYIHWDCRPWFEADGSVGGIVLYTEVNTQRKRAEEAARLNADMFRKAFQLSPDAININRLSDGAYVSVNPGFTSNTGYTAEDVLGKTSMEIDIWADPEDRARLAAGLREKGSVYNLEARFRRKDGSIETALMSAAIIELDGEPHILSVTRGIGEIKRIQEESRKREAVHQAMIANISDVIAVVDSEGVVRYKSPNIRKYFGWSPEEWIGRSGFDSVHPEDLERVKEAFARIVAKENESVAVECRYRCKDGRYCYVKITGVNLLHDPNISGVLVNYHDISERRSEAERMKVALKKLQFHLENGPLAYVEFDRNFRITAWSKTAEAFFGWKAEEVLGKRMDEFPFIHEDDLEAIKSLGRDMLLAKKFGNVHVNRNRRKDGAVITCQWYNSVLLGDREDEFSVLSLVLDITESLKAEERILNLLREKELILKEVHHRVKNNMSVVISLLGMDEAAMENEAARTVLADAAGRVRSMMVLYDKLYRSQDTGFVAAREYFPALVKEIVSLFPRKTPVRIETRIDDVTLSARLLSPLGIIVNEFITNAMKYAFAGREDAAIAVTLARQGNRLTLVFEDNGQGMPEGVDAKSTQGFGLQLVEMLVKQVRGSLKMELNRGTRFIIEFGIEG